MKRSISGLSLISSLAAWSVFEERSSVLSWSRFGSLTSCAKLLDAEAVLLGEHSFSFGALADDGELMNICICVKIGGLPVIQYAASFTFLFNFFSDVFISLFIHRTTSSKCISFIVFLSFAEKKAWAWAWQFRRSRKINSYYNLTGGWSLKTPFCCLTRGPQRLRPMEGFASGSASAFSDFGGLRFMKHLIVGWRTFLFFEVGDSEAILWQSSRKIKNKSKIKICSIKRKSRLLGSDRVQFKGTNRYFCFDHDHKNILSADRVTQ